MKGILIVLSLILNFSLHAAQRDTHGGGYFHCPHGDQSSTFNLLDLWEGQELKNLKYRIVEGSLSEQLTYLYHKFEAELSPEFSDLIQENMSKLFRITRFIEQTSSVVLSAPQDAQNNFRKRGCELRGVASYKEYPHNDDILYIDKLAYEKLSSFEQASLYVHEAVYKILRDEVGAINSVLARNITANITAINPRINYFNNKTLICTDRFGENSFYVDEQKWSRGLSLYFVNIYSEANNHISISEYPNYSLSLFIKEEPRISLRLTGKPYMTSIQFETVDTDDNILNKMSNIVLSYKIMTARDFEIIRCYERI